MTRFTQHTKLDPDFVSKKLDEFFKEDHIDYDITTTTTQHNRTVDAVLVARENLIFAGHEIIKQGFADCIISMIADDGESLNHGDVIANISGGINTILKKERVVLNLIQRLCGIASKVNQLSRHTRPYDIELLDTRKTTPGLRMFEKFAVAVGGGTNHRFSLKDAVMIKDNHLVGSPDIIRTVAKAKKENPNKDIQLEVDTQEQLKFALESEATSLLLDNFKPQILPDVIEHIRSHSKGEDIYIELSGGITEETLSNFCIKGVNGISMGALTHNITSKDIGLDIK
tara:strand:- start:353 stop:1207 length:855 start_codon:yes stop_codon:yes gene_type:complete